MKYLLIGGPGHGETVKLKGELDECRYEKWEEPVSFFGINDYMSPTITSYRYVKYNVILGRKTKWNKMILATFYRHEDMAEKEAVELYNTVVG